MGSLVLAGATSGSTTIQPTDAVTATVTLPSTGGTLQTSGAGFTTNGVAYASSTSALATGSVLTWDGATFKASVTTPQFLANGAGSDGNGAGPAFGITSNAGADQYYMRLNGSKQYSVYGYDASNSANGWCTLSIADGGKWQWYTANTERMRLTSAGYLGIGTTTPAKLLDVSYSTTSTTATTAATMQLVNPQNAVGYYSGVINFCRISSSQPMAYIGSVQTDTVGNSANALVFGTRNGGSTVDERIRIDADGTLLSGITSTVANAKFAVQNTNQTYSFGFGTVGTNNAFYVVISTGTGVYLASGGNSWSANSDSRLKNVTGTYTNALADISQIQPVKFTWKSDETNAPQVGVIAQSVQNVVPEAISHSKLPGSEDETEYLGVRYTELIPLMIASIQELSALVTAQSATITSLTERITALEGK